MRSAPIGLALVLAARVVPVDRALAFADAVEAGKADETDPSRLLHLRLRDAALAKQRLAQVEVAALTVIAFNAWFAGRTLKHLRIDEQHRTGGGFPRVVTQ